MLVDAADDDAFNKIKATLDKYDITKIDVLVATHSHDDHIGSMDELINSFDIGTIYLTPFFDETETCEDLLDAVERFGVSKIYAEPGMRFKLGDALVLSIGAGRRKFGRREQ